MIRASSPRSQVSSLPAEFAEMEPTRFCSVGENRIKLYSNMRPNASIRCDQSANCSYAIPGLPQATRIAKSCLNIAKVQIEGYGNSFTLTAVCNAFGGSWRIQ